VPLDSIVPDLTMKQYSSSKILFDDITIGNKLGEGSTASVFKATLDDETVAVKMLNVEDSKDSYSKREFSKTFNEFRREAAIMR
jgi:serine/threonine protein kinase